MNLAPLRDVEAIDPDAGRWRAVGPDPCFAVGAGASLPGGWCRLACDLANEAGPPPTPSLYADEGFGPSEYTRIPLPWAAGRIDGLVFLPPGLRALRFDPVEGTGGFRLAGFVLEPLPASDPRHAAPPPRDAAAFRDGALALFADGDLAPLDGTADGWEAIGPDPRFHLELRGRLRILRGRWVRLEVGLAPLDGTRIEPSLFLGCGPALRERDRVPLHWARDRIDDVVFVPSDATSLRIDPVEGRGRFRVGRVRLRPIGRARAWARLAGRFRRTLLPAERSWPALLRAARTLRRHFTVRELADLFVRRARRPPVDPLYADWIARVEAPDLPSRAAMEAAVAWFRTRPVFSLVVPVYDTPKEWLVAAIESVRAQGYPHWELCLCDDASPAAHVWPLLQDYAARDRRIRIVRRPENGHIARATNDALALATGTHMVLMDHDDLLPRHALFAFAQALQEEPAADFLYSDEDKISLAGTRYGPFFKPDWSPDYLEGCMYTAHLACYDMAVVRRVGGFRPACDGAQDYDFVLRFAEQARHVRHIPKILYHWRAIPGSTAADLGNKDYVVAASLRALDGRVARTGAAARVEPGPTAGCFTVRRRIRGGPLVSVAAADPGLAVPAFDPTGAVRVERVPAEGASAAAAINRAARSAAGELLLLLDEHLAAETPDWLETLVAAVQVDGVGAAGPKILNADGTVREAGVTVEGGRPAPVGQGWPASEAGYGYGAVCRRSHRALGGSCLLVRRDLFLAAGGLDESLPVALAGIDLSLTLGLHGHRVVCEPAARLRAQAGAPEPDPAALERFRARWAATTDRDPFYPRWFGRRPAVFGLDPGRF